MEKQIVVRLHKDFEQAAYQQDSVEYWLAHPIIDASRGKVIIFIAHIISVLNE